MTCRVRTALAGGTATLVLFVWGAFSHLVLIRGVGYSAIPDEDAFAQSLAASGIAPGLYAFPAPPDWRGEQMNDATIAAWEGRFRDGPAGMLVVRPRGVGPFSAQKLLVQLGANALAVGLALFVVSAVGGSFWRRVASVTALGLVGLASVGVIYWNWYAFPDAFFCAQALDVLGGWLLVGCVLAALAPRRASGGDSRSGAIGAERPPS